MRGKRNVGFVARFTLISAVLLGGVGVVLASLLGALIEERATEGTADFGEALTRLGLVPILDPDDLEGPFTVDTAAEVEAAVAALGVGSPEMRPLRLKIFNADGVMVHSDNPELVGGSFKSSDLRRALEGNLVSAYTELESLDEADEQDFTEALEVYVPIELGTGRTVGVVEIYLPWGPVAADIRHDRRVVYGVLVAALGVFYLVMSRLVWQTSRRLRTSAERNAYLAHHDTLTGLPNRALLLERLEQSIARSHTSGGGVGVLLIDLDRFKEVNDTLGHDVGDELLSRVGGRLADQLRGIDTVARLGGDEFVALLPQIASVSDAEAAATRILEALHRPFTIRGMELAVEASVGVACYPDHGEESGTLLQHADVAMYTAKRDRGVHKVYDPCADGSSLARMTMVTDLRRALEQDQFFLHYQPKQELADGTVRSVEALIRWQHPQLGMIPPGDFIPVAEQTGLIVALTDRVVAMAMSQLCAWQRAGLELSVSVNLSARNLTDVGLPARIACAAEELGVDLALLEVEVTETSAMADPAGAAVVLRSLADLGVRVSIDDYGTGYSSLAYLRGLSVHALKIDGSFVTGMLGQPDDAVIVRSTIDMAHNLGLEVVAEGVEDAATLQELRGLGCDVAQGYFLSPPLPADELLEFVRESEPSQVGAAVTAELATASDETGDEIDEKAS